MTKVVEYKDKPKKGKFRLLAGKHAEGGRIFTRGQIVYSTFNLEKLNGDGQAKKFERVEDDVKSHKGRAIDPATAEKEEEEKLEAKRKVADAEIESQTVEGRESDDGEEFFSREDLEQMTNSELTELAKSEQIDLGGANVKRDIIAAILGDHGEEEED